MDKKDIQILFLLLLTMLWYSCSPVRYLQDDQTLYTGGSVSFQPDTGTVSKYKDNLSDLLRPKPNSSIFGLYPNLFFYNISREPTGKGLNYLLHEKWGEKPVLGSSLNLKMNEKILQNFLENKGFFHAKVKGETKVHRQKLKAKYKVDAGHRYTINQVSYPKDTGLKINRMIDALKKKSLLTPGKFYDLETVKSERERIKDTLKDKGYYYFTPDDMVVLVDSTLNGKVDMYLQLKKDAPKAALQQYAIHQVNVYPNYSLKNIEHPNNTKPLHYKGLNIYDKKDMFRPSIFHRSIYLHPGNLYHLSDHELTLNRLVNLGVFKYVKVAFQPVDSTKGKRLLDANIYLSPAKKKSLKLQINGNSRSNNFVGSGVTFSWQNKNIFRGAELLKLNLNGSFETQVGGNQASANTYSFSPGVEIEVPRFVTPFQVINMSRVKVPKTFFKVNYELLHRQNYYNLNSFNFKAGYRWRQNTKISHTLDVFNVSYILPSHLTPVFKDIIKKDPTLQRSFRKQFILSSDYSFEYSDKSETHKRNNFYFLGNVDIAGNLIGLFSGKHSHKNPSELFGIPFSQYVKLSGDFRDYWKLNHKGVEWVNRIFMGYGYAYGNSYSLPFVKQFFDGGSNSLRGFRARTLGPGSYHTNQTGFQANEAGDIKFEFNSELRFPIASILKGAAFVDAGNIWLLRADSTRPGGKFQINHAFNQLAVDAGLGFRLDLSFFVLRFDVAFPLRKPWLPKGNRWVFDEINFGNKAWRKQNLILNIAIGYPF